MCLLALPASYQGQVRKEVKVSQASLAVQIELDKDAEGKVVVVNRGNAEITLWRMGNSWGDDTLSFEVSRDSGKESITYAPQTYTRNVPGTVVVPAAGRYEIPFNLKDGKWGPAAAIDKLSGADARLTAIYTIRQSPEALSHRVWIGELRSQPVQLK
jgi:hypothetical protein